jgi:chemotaxis protein MotB
VPAKRDDSGVLVYPRLPMPSRRANDPRGGTGANRRLIAVVAGAVIAGGVGAWMLRPILAPDPRIAAAARRADEATQSATAHKERADALQAALDAATKAKLDAEGAQAQLAVRVATETTAHEAAEAVQTKLKAVVDRTTSAVVLDGGDVHLQLAERALFRPGDDALTDRGKQMLSRIAGALKDMSDRLIWVQGHTDEPTAPAAGKPVAAAKKPVRPPAPSPGARFATTWELSAARALAVVHYLQDVAKLEPTRLAALAFGSYAPLPGDRAASRRIEIVVIAKRGAN